MGVTGLTENEAIALTSGWREQLNHPRLKKDDIFARFFGDGNLNAFRHLSVANENVDLFTLSNNGIDAHSHVHSLRMGELIGKALNAGSSNLNLRDITTTVLTNNTLDFGEPVSQQEYEAQSGRRSPKPWCWNMKELTLQFDRSVDVMDSNHGGGGGADPYIVLQYSYMHLIALDHLLRSFYNI